MLSSRAHQDSSSRPLKIILHFAALQMFIRIPLLDCSGYILTLLHPACSSGFLFSTAQDNFTLCCTPYVHQDSSSRLLKMIFSFTALRDDALDVTAHWNKLLMHRKNGSAAYNNAP
jgi:hypothetical protein